jgi:hypothetical protein
MEWGKGLGILWGEGRATNVLESVFQTHQTTEF